MKKSRIQLILVFVVLAIVFSALAFYLVEDITASWIIAYAFIILDFVLLALVTLLGDPKYAYLRFGINAIAFIGVAVSALVNVLIMLFSPIKVSLTLIINVVITGIAVALYLIPSAQNSAAIARDKEIERKRSFILEDRDKVRIAMSSVTDFYLKKDVERAYDAISNAVIDGHSDTSALESAIDRNCDMLISACESGNVAEIKRLSEQIVNDIKKRETLLKSR